MDPDFVALAIDDTVLFNVYHQVHPSLRYGAGRALERVRTLIDDNGLTKYIIAGDLNLHHSNWCCCPKCRSPRAGQPRGHSETSPIERAHCTWLLSQCSLVSARFTPTFTQGGSNLDHVWVSHDAWGQASMSGRKVALAAHSDHEDLQWKWKPSPRTNRPPTFGLDAPPRLNYRKLDPEALVEYLEDTLLHMRFPNPSTPNKIDQFAELLGKTLTTAAAHAAPVLNISVHSNPAWTDEVAQMHKEAVKARHLALRSQLDADHAAATAAQQAYTDGVNLAGEKYFTDALLEATGNEIWSLRATLARKPKSPPTPALRSDACHDGIATTLENKAHAMLQRHFPESVQQGTCPVASPDTLLWPELHVKEVEDALMGRPQQRRAPGPDQLPDLLLRAAWASDVFRRRLTELLRACTAKGYHLRAWRSATVVMLRKSGKRGWQDPGSYRPISLLNTVSKLLERIMRARLAFLLSDKLPREQYGNRTGYSTSDALWKFTSDVDRNSTPDAYFPWTSALFVDIKGAYDNVKRGPLCRTLQDFGVPAAACRWVWHFMTERNIALRLDDELCPPSTRTCGIPQGSPVSPLLFNVAIAPLYTMVTELGLYIVGYADDLTIYKPGTDTASNAASLERALARIHQWLQERHFELDYGDKLQFAHFRAGFTPRGRNKAPQDSITLPTGRVKMPDETVRLLGVDLDMALSFKAHKKRALDKMVAAASTAKGIVAQYAGAPATALRTLYVACVRPTIEYASMVWMLNPYAPEHRAFCDQAQVVQNSLARFALQGASHTPIAVLCKELHMPPIRERFADLHARQLLRLKHRLHRFNPAATCMRREALELYGENQPLERPSLRRCLAADPIIGLIDPDFRHTDQEFPRATRVGLVRRPTYSEEPPPGLVDLDKTIADCLQELAQAHRNKWDAWTASEAQTKGAHYFALQDTKATIKPNKTLRLLWRQPPKTLARLSAWRAGHCRSDGFTGGERELAPCPFCELPHPGPAHPLLDCPHFAAVWASTLLPSTTAASPQPDARFRALLFTVKGLQSTITFMKEAYRDRPTTLE